MAVRMNKREAIVRTKQPSARETAAEAADSIVRQHLASHSFKNKREWMDVSAAISCAVEAALLARDERACRFLCPFCSNPEYDLVFHHDEWRHYRKTDNHVQYCQATAIRKE